MLESIDMSLGWKMTGAGMDILAVMATNDASAGVSAAGTTQATATELTNASNEVSTVASGSGVILSSKGTPGDEMDVFNAGLNPLKVYPPVGMKLNALSTNAPMVLSVNTGCHYVFLTTTRVMAVLSA